MDYHQLRSLRDYWSTDPDLAVPFIANIMPRKRCEELQAYVHFNNNAMMKSWEHPDHDRAFKVRLVLNYFNTRFLSALTATQHQSIDEHMVKLKGHNILRQFVNTSFTGNFLHQVLRRGRFRPRSCFANCVFLALVFELLVCCIAMVTHNKIILLLKNTFCTKYKSIN